MNHLQKKLIAQCQNKGMSIKQTYETLQAQRDLCIKMENHAEECFARKVFKKSVMCCTNYGATQRTSRSDVLYQLKAMESSFLYSCTPSEITMFTNMVFWSLEEGVPSAMNFLTYFRKLLHFVLKYKDEVFYINPLTGFPVALRVKEKESKDYVYKVAGRNVKVCLFKELQTTNTTKTTSSSVPSIIHSIDAAILILIKNHLKDQDVSIIHDSIGTHPNSTNKARTAVANALYEVSQGDVYKKIVEQLLEGIPPTDIPKHLLESPYEGTWTNINKDEWYNAYS